MKNQTAQPFIAHGKHSIEICPKGGKKFYMGPPLLIYPLALTTSIILPDEEMLPLSFGLIIYKVDGPIVIFYHRQFFFLFLLCIFFIFNPLLLATLLDKNKLL